MKEKEEAEIQLEKMKAILQTNPGSRLEDQQDGNLVVYSTYGNPIWASGLNNTELRKLLKETP